MPLIIRDIAAAAAAADYFPIQGSQYEYLPFNAVVEFAITQVGTTDANQATVYSGSDLLQEEAPTQVKAAIAAIYPDDFTLSDVAAAGERLGVRVRKVGNTDPVRVTVRITPL